MSIKLQQKHEVHVKLLNKNTKSTKYRIWYTSAVLWNAILAPAKFLCVLSRQTTQSTRLDRTEQKQHLQ